MGNWNSTTQYQKLNIVRSHGATYQAKRNNQGVEPTVTAGWQDVWQVVAYDGGEVNPDGDYPGMSVGNATNAQNDGSGNNIANQFEQINSLIPSSTTAENQLANEAFVNSSINNMAAFYIESNAQGDAWPTRDSLLNATTFYNAGQARVPTTNDYATVLADESQPQGADGSYPTTRYSYQGGTYPNGQWGFQYVVNNTSLTQAQVNAINSGITKELVEQIGTGQSTYYASATATGTGTPGSINATIEGFEEKIGVTLVLNFPGTVTINESVTLIVINGGNGRQVKYGTNVNIKPYISTGDICTFVFDGSNYKLISVDKKAVVGATPKYRHHISSGYMSYRLYFSFDTEDATPYSGEAAVAAALYKIYGSNSIEASGSAQSSTSSAVIPVYSVKSPDGKTLKYTYGVYSQTEGSPYSGNATDMVVPL
ncbi:MAG: hypothetical protein J1E81_06270 [Eubacterium sp.]|nr:hypothetical protein [Eubacterium sp.]